MVGHQTIWPQTPNKPISYNWPVTCGPTTTKLWLNYWYSGVSRFASGGMKGSQHGNGLLILYGSLRAHSSQWRPNILTYVCRGRNCIWYQPGAEGENGQCDSPYRLDHNLYVLCLSFFCKCGYTIGECERCGDACVALYAISFSLLLFLDCSPGIITAKLSVSHSFVSVISILYGEMVRWIVMYGIKSFRRVDQGGWGPFVAKPRLLTISELAG